MAKVFSVKSNHRTRIFVNTFSAARRPVSAAPFIKPQKSVLQCSRPKR